MKARKARHDEASPGGVFAPLFGAGRPAPAAVAAFLAERGFPVAEPGLVTFAWSGKADRVELVRWINANPERLPFRRVPGTTLWVLRLPVEDGGRFEYKLALTRGADEDWVLDPLNPIRAGDPLGENPVCRTHGYAPPDWTSRRGAPAGRIVSLTIDSTVFAETREERVYLPAGYAAGGAYPLVVVHDGRDYATYGDLTVALDNLIAAGDIPPLLALLIQTEDRMGEYPRRRRHARYVVDELLPAAAAGFSL